MQRENEGNECAQKMISNHENTSKEQQEKKHGSEHIERKLETVNSKRGTEENDK